MTSVFNRKTNTNNMKPTGNEKWIPCNQYHRIDDKIPEVDPSIHDIQNKDLMLKECDCRKCIFIEEMCGCPNSEKKWEIKWLPNPNY